MDIPIHADVVCRDGLVGKSTHIVVDLVSEQVTHFVAKADHDNKQFVVPLNKIRDSKRTVILLDCHKEDVYQLPLFHESSFNAYYAYDSAPPLPSLGVAASDTLYQPYREADFGTHSITLESSWARLAVNKGASVYATDGKVGKIDELVIDPETHRVTHLVLRQHFLLNKWIVTIPVSDIERADKDSISLKLDKAAIEALPAVALKKFLWE